MTYAISRFLDYFAVKRVFGVDDEVDEISANEAFRLISQSVDLRMQVVEIAKESSLERKKERKREREREGAKRKERSR